MNDQELNDLLKSAPVPRRTATARHDFIATVVRRLRCGDGAVRTEALGWVPVGVWGWGLAAAGVVLVAGFAFFAAHRPSARDSAATEEAALWQQLARMFPRQLKAVVLEGGNTRLILSEQADQPLAKPIRVQLGQGPRWCSVITFSGQSVKAEGVDFEVLSDADDHVWLIGERAVWSSADASRRFGELAVKANVLEVPL